MLKLQMKDPSTKRSLGSYTMHACCFRREILCYCLIIVVVTKCLKSESVSGKEVDVRRLALGATNSKPQAHEVVASIEEPWNYIALIPDTRIK